MPTTKRTKKSVSKPKPSKLEEIKKGSLNLRGTVKDELQNAEPKFSDSAKQLLKFHGTYQQEDRDARKNRAKTGIQKHFMFMVRCKMPGGRFTADQFLQLEELADRYANSTLRFTSRQGIQLHGVLKKNLQRTIAEINEMLLTTLGACGDVERNVMSCPAPLHQDGVREQLYQYASQIAEHLAPRSNAYHEIWLNGTNTNGSSTTKRDREPIYGKAYLPRKFKTGLAVPEDNCIDIYTQDLGFLADVKNGEIIGFNVLCGGGSGMTHGNPDTFPCVSKPICYITPDEVVKTAEAVAKLFRDNGNRSDRKRARLKYVLKQWGVTKFRRELKGYIGKALKRPKEMPVTGFDTHLGWHEQGDGQFFYGVSIPSGRVKDEEDYRIRSALHEIIKTWSPELRVTPYQDLLLCNLPKKAHTAIRKTLTAHGVALPNKLTPLDTLSLACPAIPTCGLALSESERMMTDLLAELGTVTKRLGLRSEEISVRTTGCPNGCVRPYQSEIGIVGRSGEKYTLFLGGHNLGHRMNEQFLDLVPRDQIVPTLTVILKHFKNHREQGEGFGDFCHRIGNQELLTLLPDQK